VILFRRLFLVISIVVTGSLGMAAAAIAAGGGGGLPPGNYTFNYTFAFAQFGTPIPPNFAPQFVINVQLDACANLQSFWDGRASLSPSPRPSPDGERARGISLQGLGVADHAAVHDVRRARHVRRRV
jgi:hypothetical protein